MTHRKGIATSTLAAAAAVSVLISGCSSSSHKDTKTSDGKTTVTMEVLESSLGTVLHAIAEKKGSYAAQGLNIKVQVVNSGEESVSVQQLVQGRADFAFVTAPSVATLDSAYVSKGQDAPLKVVAATSNVSNVVVSSKVDYTDLNSLHGLKIGLSSLTSDHRTNFDYYLAQHNQTASGLDIKYVPISASDMPAALASGQIDGFIHSEPTTTLAITRDHAKLAFSMDGLVKTKATSVLAASADYIKKHADTVKKVVAALKDASTKFSSMTDADLVPIYAGFIKAPTDLMTQVVARKDYNPGLEPLRAAADAFWTVSVPSMLSQKVITSKLHQDDLFDYSFS